MAAASPIDNLRILGAYSARMAAGDFDAVFTGTHTGAPFFGVAPSGEAVTINGTAILRMRDRKVVEHWGGPHCSEGIGVAGARFDAA